MKKLISVFLVLVMLLTMVPAGVAATELPTEEMVNDWFTNFGFASMDSSRNDRYFAPGEAVPDNDVFMFLTMSGDLNQYLNRETWYYELTYDQYMAIVDRYFVNHSDMKDHLTKFDYYDPETGAVRFYSGGYGDAWAWVVLSTYHSGNIYKIQGLFLNQPVEDFTGLTENIDYYTYIHEYEGITYTSRMYIDSVLEMTLLDSEEGWKILGYELGDYYIVEQDNDAALYAVDSETREVEEIYSRVRLFGTGTAFMTQGEEPKALKDALTSFESNDDLWYVSDLGFSWAATATDGYVLSEVMCYTPDGAVLCGTQGTVEPGTGAVELWANPDAVIDVDAPHASIEVLQGLREYGEQYLYSNTGVVELKVTADPGYEVISVSMGGVESQYMESTGTYVIYPSFGPAMLTVETQLKFTDIPKGSFYDEPVRWAVDNGITSGATDTTFNPNGNCLRAQVVTFLWRAVGCPEPTTTVNPFKDVKSSDWYYKAVLWASENNITAGADATHFNPMGVCNRAQVVTFLYRAFGSPAVGSVKSPFTDVAAGTWYAAPVLWAVNNSITAGQTATSFGPNANCNRAQIVTFLYRAYN